MPKNHGLEKAMALLIQNQALFVNDMRAFVAEMRESAKQMIEIRRDIEQIKAILIRHEQLLAGLPEAIRDKIGFKTT